MCGDGKCESSGPGKRKSEISGAEKHGKGDWGSKSKGGDSARIRGEGRSVRQAATIWNGTRI